MLTKKMKYIMTNLEFLVIVPLLIIVATTFLALLVRGNFNIIALSDLGDVPTTSLIFNLGIVIKSLSDLVWLWLIFRKSGRVSQKLKFIAYLWPFSFLMLAVIKTNAFNLLHWFFAVIYFISILYFQYLQIKNNRFDSKSKRVNIYFIATEIIMASLGLISQSFYLYAESVVFLLINMWQWNLSKRI